MMQGQIPAGLGALLQRTPDRRQQSHIPPGLQALMQAQQVLRQQANPMTPTGAPTVAGQTEQAIAQQMQSQQPQQAAPGMMPSDPFREQLMKTLQMQAQQQMAPPGGGQPPEQPSQQMPEQPPQGMASGGIARLPADNMARIEQYAHGGVIGFYGEEGSVAKTNEDLQAELENARNMAEAAAKSQDTESALSYASKVNQLQSELNKRSAPAVKSSRFQSSGAPKGLTTERIEQIKDEYKQNLGLGAMPGQYRRGAGGAPVALTEEEKAAATEAALKKQRAGRESRPYTGEYRPSTASVPITSSPEEMEKQETARLLKSHPVPEWNIDSLLAQQGAKQVAAPSSPSTQRTAVKPAAPVAGIAAGIAEPKMADQIAIAQQMVPENPLRQKILGTAEQILAKQKERPDIEGQGIAALQQYEKERLRQLEEQKGGDFFRRMSALGRDFYERGSNDRLGRIDDLIAARNSESNKAALASKEMELKLRDAAHQKEIGNLEAYKKTMEEVASLDEKRTGHMVNAAQVGAHLAGQTYTAKMSAASSAATNATQLEIARMHQQTLLMQPSDQKRIDDLTRVYILKSTGGKPPTPDQYLEAMKNAMEDVRGASQAGSRDIKAQTEANKQLDAFKTSMEYVTAKTPAEQQALLRKKQAELERQYPGAIFGTEASSDLIKKADAIVKGGR